MKAAIWLKVLKQECRSEALLYILMNDDDGKLVHQTSAQVMVVSDRIKENAPICMSAVAMVLMSC